MDVLNLIGRNSPLFKDDIANNENYLKMIIHRGIDNRMKYSYVKKE